MEFTWKVVVLGDPAVGKTTLVLYYTQRSFKEFYLPTIGADFSIKEVDVDNKNRAKVFIWDIAAQARFSQIRKMFYEKAAGALFMYDVTNRKSFDAIETWKDDLVESLGSEFPCSLVANKIDLEEARVISSEEGFEKASDLGMGYFETSAKNGVGVDDAFMNLFVLILDRMK